MNQRLQGRLTGPAPAVGRAAHRCGDAAVDDAGQYGHEKPGHWRRLFGCPLAVPAGATGLRDVLFQNPACAGGQRHGQWNGPYCRRDCMTPVPYLPMPHICQPSHFSVAYATVLLYLLNHGERHG